MCGGKLSMRTCDFRNSSSWYCSLRDSFERIFMTYSFSVNLEEDFGRQMTTLPPLPSSCKTFSQQKRSYILSPGRKLWIARALGSPGTAKGARRFCFLPLVLLAECARELGGVRGLKREPLAFGGLSASKCAPDEEGVDWGVCPCQAHACCFRAGSLQVWSRLLASSSAGTPVTAILGTCGESAPVAAASDRPPSHAGACRACRLPESGKLSGFSS
mmetsp:Transcript_16217/g.50922  ORF Transcript_16217/g.50922 Transcript_16217/m.50922 type:complete len:216 (-) Transcript_16217:743-1390(-)